MTNGTKPDKDILAFFKPNGFIVRDNEEYSGIVPWYGFCAMADMPVGIGDAGMKLWKNGVMLPTLAAMKQDK